MPGRESWLDVYDRAYARIDRRVAEELPVHELAFAADATRWFQSVPPASLLDTVAEAIGGAW